MRGAGRAKACFGFLFLLSSDRLLLFEQLAERLFQMLDLHFGRQIGTSASGGSKGSCNNTTGNADKCRKEETRFR